MKTVEQLIIQGYAIHKDNLISKEFALIKAKEMQGIGYQTQIARNHNFYAVMIIQRTNNMEQVGYHQMLQGLTKAKIKPKSLKKADVLKAYNNLLKQKNNSNLTYNNGKF